MRDPPSDLVRLLDMVLARAQGEPSSLIPDFRESDTLLVASDYAGEHSGATHRAYGFLLTTGEAWRSWEPRRLELRRHWLPDNRRMSFKRMADGQRQRFLRPFLAHAGTLRGALVIFVVPRKVRSLFSPDGRPDTSVEQLAALSDWATSDLEKLVRVATFLGVLISGTSREGQEVHWLTDEDSIIANQHRREAVLSAISAISTAGLQHDLRAFRAISTGVDATDLRLEDLAAIPDLAAGAIVELEREYDAVGVSRMSELMVPPPPFMAAKAQQILNWFADPRLDLARVVVFIDHPAADRMAVVHRVYRGGVVAV